MPWKLKKQGSGFVVVTKDTGRKHSKHPLPKARAEAQLRALYASEAKKGGKA